MSTQPIAIETLIEAPIDVVWKAITDKNEMADWYFTIEEFEASPDFTFQFYGGDNKKAWLHICQVKDVEPNKKLSYTWRYENSAGTSLVTFGLTEVERKTLVKLTHEGVEGFAELGDYFSRESFVTGWNHMIGSSLKDYVEEQEFYWKGKQLVDVSLSRMWEVITVCDLNREWGKVFSKEQAGMDSTWEKGSRVEWKTPTGEVTQRAVAEEIEVGRYLKIVENTRGVGRRSDVFEFVEQDGKVLFSLETGPFRRKIYYIMAPMWERAWGIIKETAEKKDEKPVCVKNL